MGLTFFEQRRRLLAKQREMEEVGKKAVEEPVTELETVTEPETETVTEDETTEDSKPKKAVKGKE
nr:MAG TPA: hypothetical protein [Caudoviricetes sp.]